MKSRRDNLDFIMLVLDSSYLPAVPEFKGPSQLICNDVTAADIPILNAVPP